MLKTTMTFFFFLLITTSPLLARECNARGMTESGKYGDGYGFYTVSCMTSIKTYKSEYGRLFTFNDDGLVQIVSNFKGSTITNSTGARVYYLFPRRVEKNLLSDEDQLTMQHQSGVRFKFDKNGNVSSPDVKIKVESAVSGTNNGGVEIQSYARGIVIDLGYKNGNTPQLDKNRMATITDKANKKCSVKNTSLNKFVGSEAKFAFETDFELYHFLKTACPQLDLSDLINPMKDSVEALVKTKKMGVVSVPASVEIQDSKRAPKPKVDELEQFLEKMEAMSVNK